MQAIRRFIQEESSSALLLLCCALSAFILSNSPWQHHYTTWVQGPILIHLPNMTWSLNLRWIINEGLMTLFFLVVGLEIKYELIDGALNTRAKALLPAIAALGGMLVPALIYVAFNYPTTHYLSGWAIPTATDLAFSLGILHLLGRRVPHELKIFLTTLAIFDDLAAILIIAFFYTETLALTYLLLAFVIMLLLITANRRQFTPLSVYLVLGIALWVCLYKAGIHPTLAGIVLGFTMPTHTHANSPATRLKHLIHPWVPAVILPLFALSNAGVTLQSITQTAFPWALFWGCALGLLIGKPLGVLSFIWLALRWRIGALAMTIHWYQLIAMALLCGIGFTISIFLANLTFDTEPLLLNVAKLGVLTGSLCCGIVGVCAYVIGTTQAKGSGASPC